MMDFLNEYGLFLAKSITVVLAILAAVGGCVAISRSAGARSRERLQVRHLNRHYDDMALALRAAMLPKKAFKEALKIRRKERKHQKQTETAGRRKIFVLNFHGDIRGAQVAALREEVTAILTVAGADDEVVVRLESGGGLVHAYGLAASQLARLKDKKLRLTVAVDKLAASGGYMMASVADHLIAAPFAVLGSIGVVTQLPNFHRLLKKHDIDFEMFTAGEFKRTLTLFGENTDKAREKVREEVEEVHGLFKAFIKTHRPQLDVAAVSTGEYWYGARALELHLVDELRTSDDYLLEASASAELYEVAYKTRKPLSARLVSFAEGLLSVSR